MKRTSDFKRHNVNRIDCLDGTILLESNDQIDPIASNTGEWLDHWASMTGERTFLAERSGAGWREESYASTFQKVKALASSLLSRGLNSSTPILIMSGNSVDHGLLALAAQYIGVPTVPVAEQYSLIPAAHGRLQQAVELVRPAIAYVNNASKYAEALALDVMNGIEIIASQSESAPHATKVTPFQELLNGDEGVDLAAAHATVNPDTIVKILMTSGSTSAPKGVLTTHRMMCANQAQLVVALPFLRDHPPRIVDWLPWNHVFGGSHNFNMMLANGGSLYIDDGKPVKGLFNRTLENLSMVTGTLSFNVPVGFSMLAGALQNDKSLRQRFFENLDMLFYSGASLPQNIWESFEKMAMEIKGEVPLMTSSWGLTETAPALLIQQEPTPSSGIIGVPLPGVTAKLLPSGENRFEIRVKGPNVMPGYFENPDKTAAVFDDEEYFITGDAMKLVDPTDPNAGLKFDGRISEDFKLLTGTWVRAARLRIDVLAALGPIAADVVITGADRDQIGLFIFPNLEEFSRLGFIPDEYEGTYHDPALLTFIRDKLLQWTSRTSGSSNQISRAIVVSEPASLADGEITAKGNLNFPKILVRRKSLLDRLYDNSDQAVAKLQDK